MKRYNVRWYVPTDRIVSRADVDIMARDDAEAKRKADQTAKDLNVDGFLRLIYDGDREVK
jgi:hypothetical protein